LNAERTGRIASERLTAERSHARRHAHRAPERLTAERRHAHLAQATHASNRTPTLRYK